MNTKGQSETLMKILLFALIIIALLAGLGYVLTQAFS